jgi:hypothetical protein
MSDSSDDETSVSSQQSKWIRISDRPEWSDVKPVQQDEGPIPVVRIAYSEKCKSFVNNFYFQFVILHQCCCNIVLHILICLSKLPFPILIEKSQGFIVDVIMCSTT